MCHQHLGGLAKEPLKGRTLPKLGRNWGKDSKGRAGSAGHSDALGLGEAQPRFCDSRGGIGYSGDSWVSQGCCQQPQESPLHQLHPKKYQPSSGGWKIPQELIASFWAGGHLGFLGGKPGESHLPGGPGEQLSS